MSYTGDNKWSVDDRAILVGHLDKGLTVSQVAAAMGKTTNSIIGYVHRSGLKMKSGLRNQFTVRPVKVKKSHEAERITAKRTHAGNGLGGAPHCTPKPDFSVGKKTLLELAANDCRFICSDDLFCAGPKDEGSSYCPKHRARCCYPLPPQTASRITKTREYANYFVAKNF